MARLNTPVRTPAIKTHGGAPASRVSAEQQLKRSVLSCFLWEDGFYEDGDSIANRIHENAAKCSPEFVSALAKQARSEFKLRHAPIWLMQSLIGREGMKAQAICDAIQRPDEIAEYLAMYWRDGKKPMPNQMKKGLAMAFNKFDEYQLAKWNRKNAIRLRDVMFLVRPKPKDKQQAEIFKRLANDDLAIPKTRETMLSSGQDAGSTYTELLSTGKLGHMALLKNLKTMTTEKVDRALVKKELARTAKNSMALPMRYLTAVRHAPSYAAELDQAMLQASANLPKLSGTTSVLIDCSGSMNSPVSGRSEMTMRDAATALAVHVREVAEGDCRIFAFGTDCTAVANLRGLGLVSAMEAVNRYGAGPQVGHGTNIGLSANKVSTAMGAHDRMIIITDMQSCDAVSAQAAERVYFMNVASYQNSVRADGKITHIDGFSEGAVRYMVELEEELSANA